MAILYVKMQKALYGLLRSALLFYRKLVADLKSDGFVLNPYDLCVANKAVNGKQMTVCWHVDDLKVSHCNPNQVTIFGEWLSKKYSMAVTTHRGKVHDYLGMIFDFSAKGKVMVTFFEALNEAFLHGAPWLDQDMWRIPCACAQAMIARLVNSGPLSVCT